MKHRLFIAIPTPKPIRVAILNLQENLKKNGVPVRWEEPQKLHVTLNYLGEVEGDKNPALVRHLTQTISGFPTFSLKVMFMETLYLRHESSLVYVSLGGEGLSLLRDLQSHISSDLTDNLALPQPRRYFPHLTIGRIPRTDPTTTKNYLDKFQDFQPLSIPELIIDQIVLYESFLSKAGSFYQPVNTFVLK